MDKINFSKIGLGTVEIGIADYGVGQKGLPSEQEAITLLKTAAELGATYIDTARGYGVAEERIGKSGIAKKEGVIIGTKCAQWIKDFPGLKGEELEKKIKEDIEESRKQLQLDVLELVQVHLELPGYENLPEVWEIMQKIIQEGKIKHVGIATRGVDMPLQAMELGFETIQTAYSILDQRMDPTPSDSPLSGGESVFATALKTETQVINRSVLLKGTLTPARENLPAELALIKENADKADAIAQELGITLPDLAIRFCLSNAAISTALIGATKPEYIESAISAANAGSLPAKIVEQLNSLSIDDPTQIDPAHWPK